MRILSIAAIAICLASPALANEPSAESARERASVVEIDAEQIQRTMESIFERAFAAAEDDADRAAAKGEVQVAERR